MCLGISSFDNLANPAGNGLTASSCGDQVASLGNIWSGLGSLFSNGASNQPSGRSEVSGNVACIFSDLSLSDGTGAGGDVIIGGGFSGGGSSSGGGGSCSLA